jgi:hypothetical protein
VYEEQTAVTASKKKRTKDMNGLGVYVLTRWSGRGPRLRLPRAASVADVLKAEVCCVRRRDALLEAGLNALRGI